MDIAELGYKRDKGTLRHRISKTETSTGTHKQNNERF